MRRLVSFVALLSCTVVAPAYSQKTIDQEQVALAVQSGLEFLTGDQNDDGSWGGYTNQTFTSGFANVQTYRMWQVGTTGLATRTMLEQGSTKEHDAAADRALDYLIANAQLKRPAAWDVDNNWAIIYSLDAVSRALQHPRYKEHPKRDALVAAGQTLLEGMQKYQSPRGGWGYYAMPNAAWRPEWCTEFHDRRRRALARGSKSRGLGRERKDVQGIRQSAQDIQTTERRIRLRPRADSAPPLLGVHQPNQRLSRAHPSGSLGLAPRGREDRREKDIEWGLEQFVKHHKFLDVARNKPIPHEAYYANAAYFYLFAHYYASQVVQLLPEAKRAKFTPTIQEGILDASQKNGSMWDFWIADNTKPYGTAFGVMGLVNTQESAE